VSEANRALGRLDGKVAIVTGAAGGQGSELTRLFVELGARVVATDIRETEVQALAAEHPDGSVIAATHDVTSAADWERVVEHGLAQFGDVHILVNNAGVSRQGPIGELSLEAVEQVLRTNQDGCYLGIRAVSGVMTARGGGAIVNIASVFALRGGAGYAAYSASKFAVKGITLSTAAELGPAGIRVNVVLPGVIAGTDMSAGSVARLGEGGLSRLPLRRWGTPADTARVVAFLASDDAGYVTGAEIAVDGGWSSAMPTLW
jgi:3alpha(or 20beta)-hydroxysteroid dehydrogenase